MLQGQGHTEPSQIIHRGHPCGLYEKKQSGGVGRPGMDNASLSGLGMCVLRSPSLDRDKGGSRQPEARGTGRTGTGGLLQLTLGRTFHLSLQHLIPASTPLMGFCFTPVGLQRDLGEGDPALRQVCTPQELRNRWEDPGKLMVINWQTCKSPLSQPVSPQY